MERERETDYDKSDRVYAERNIVLREREPVM